MGAAGWGAVVDPKKNSWKHDKNDDGWKFGITFGKIGTEHRGMTFHLLNLQLHGRRPDALNAG